MNRAWMVLAALAAPLAAAAPAVVTPEATPCLRVRAQADAAAEIRACVVPGTALEILDSRPYWREVLLPTGVRGWAAKKFLAPIAEDAMTLAATTAAAPRLDMWLEVHFVDVGQGDGIWIHTPDDGIDGNGVCEGLNIVIDGGPNSADSANALLGYLREHAHEDAVIDALLVTHPHIDHYPGAEGIQRHFDVRTYYDPGYPKGGTAYPAFLDAMRAETTSAGPCDVRLGRDQFGELEWGSELDARILYSYPDDPTGLGSGNTRENNSSIVLRLAYGDHSFLFMGDAEGKDREDGPGVAKYVERILLESVPSELLQATVLKVGHHGSETSSTIPFIEAVSPSLVVACSGRKAYSGTYLPDATTLRRYCCHDPATRILRTDQDDEQEGRTAATDADGDHVVVRTNGVTLEVEVYSAGVRIEPPAACEPICDG